MHQSRTRYQTNAGKAFVSGFRVDRLLCHLKLICVADFRLLVSNPEVDCVSEASYVTSCREIHANDIDRVVALLTRGFGGEAYWAGALRRLTDHPTPPGLPKYGYVLEHDGALVGVILLIFTDVRIGGESHIRCNVSSWYVDPAHRSYASMLAKRATRLANVTYFNISPAPNTWSILDTQGFRPLAIGRTVSVPALNRPRFSVRVWLIATGTEPGRDLQQAEIDLLLHHTAYSALSLICEDDGQRHPFVFGLERRRGFLRIAHLVYCRDLSEFIRFAGPIGRFLLRRGIGLVEFNSNEPIAGIYGRYSRQRKYWKGSDLIHAGDVAYSEFVMFGYSGPEAPDVPVLQQAGSGMRYGISTRKAG
jgi:hypothetical protein